MAQEFFDFAIDSREANNYLGRLVQKLQGPEPFYNDVASVVQTYIDERFETETDPTGKPWADLSPATIAARKRKGITPLRKLEDTGRGRRNVKALATSSGVQVQYGGENTGYMDHHQTGTKWMAQRRFIPTQAEIESSAVVREISNAAERYLAPTLGRFVRSEIRRTKRLITR